MTPRLYSLSTVCLLKHYNQDYLLHLLRTDFTGSNGVGKSIIADLFQIVFVADTRFIKFATEGIDKKKRKIEKLPLNSGIGYVFFNIEATQGAFLTIGAAIFSQGHQLVKPFVITSSLNLEKDMLDQHTFKAEKLLFNTDLLKPGGEPYMLDELARILPERHNLYLHYFNSKEERSIYYHFLYQNELLPINLVREGNLKAYAKVIQSFSKSKALDIDSSKSLIEYLFEEDEIEINQDYQQQEQTIRKLLHQFKITKEQIYDISGKQSDLRKLKELDNERNEAAHKFDIATYIQLYQNKLKNRKEFDKQDAELLEKVNRLNTLNERSETLYNTVQEANNISQREHQILSELAGKQTLFQKLEELKQDEQALRDIDTGELMDEVPPERVHELLQKDVRYYEENIEKSRNVLKRYATVKAMERKKTEQDDWLKNKWKLVEDTALQLEKFRTQLQELNEDNLFIQALSANRNLSKTQQAVLIHLRDVAINKPKIVLSGARYVKSADLINDMDITTDTSNNGWWLKTGELYEFIPETSILLPDLSKATFESIEELKAYVDNEHETLQGRKKVYEDLLNGIIKEGFAEYAFDIDLSDATKVKGHRLAAQLCAVVNHKIVDLKKKQEDEAREVENFKLKYGITDEDVTYIELLDKTRDACSKYKDEYDIASRQWNNEQSEINQLTGSLPHLREKHGIALNELEEIEKHFTKEQQSYASRYPEEPLPDVDTYASFSQEIVAFQKSFLDKAGMYTNEYNQIVGKYQETKNQLDFRVNEQIRNQNFSFEILEQALLGNRIRTLDEVTDHLETLNSELLAIADDLLQSLTKVFGKTEHYYDKYKELVNNLNDFFKGKLISNRFYFRIDFEPAPKLDIKWIEYLRKSAAGIATARMAGDIHPEQFIEDFYSTYSGNKSKITIEDLLNPKRYFVLKGKLTDKNDRDIPGSTGESYTAIALLGIARLSVVQDGKRLGLRFLILEESATLDNINFSMFPRIAKEYGYQIITMTPKPYAIGDDEGWFIHQLIPGKENEDINYPKIMSYFRTNKTQMELGNFLKARN